MYVFISNVYEIAYKFKPLTSLLNFLCASYSVLAG